MGQAIDISAKERIRRHAPSPAPSEEAKALTPYEMKRRAQNRASQRAFRERKRSHAVMLQGQVQELQQIHDKLLQSYHHNQEEVLKLYEKIHDLEYQIQALQAQSPSLQQVESSESFQFEPVLFDGTLDRWSTGFLQTPEAWASSAEQPALYLDEHSVHLTAMSTESTV